MIILPDRTIPRSCVLLPLAPRTWSPSQRSCGFGIENQTRWRLTARLSDGHVAWRGWFDDRDDADAFLFALASGSLGHERELWDLPSSAWCPGIGEDISYDFATVAFLTSSPGSNQSYTVPADWDGAHNTIEGIGGGGTGYNNNGNSYGASGGGGGYSKISNFPAVPGASITYQLGLGATTAGANGGDTWFNAVSYPGAGTDNTRLGAKGGVGVASGNTGGAGGAAASGWGQTRYSGGAGGSSGGVAATPGGGGAGGPYGNGGNGGYTAQNFGAGGGGNGGGSTPPNVSGAPTAGGNNYAGTGGGAAASYGVNATAGTQGGGGGGGYYSGSPSSTQAGANGGPGIEWDSAHGSGGGGGGARTGASSTGIALGGNGGLYGGGGAGGQPQQNGAQGIIVVTYTPLKIFGFNVPMLGM